MDLVKRNAEIVALVKARKMPMRKIAARYRLSTSSISLIAIRHGVHAQAPDPKKVRAASKLIQRGMPLRHVAQTVGLNYQRLRHFWKSKASTRHPHQIGPGASASCASCDGITANPDVRCVPSQLSSVRTCQAVNSKAALLGLSWPLEFRASAKGTSKLSDHQQSEALKRIAAGESYRAIAKTFGVRVATVSRLRSRL